jgi:hypothetical protein
MLSGAKHLHVLLENSQMQILRSAQDDSTHENFRLSTLNLVRFPCGLR